MNALQRWHDEKRIACLYRACADGERDERRAVLFHALAGEAEGRAAIARATWTARGHSPPRPFQPDLATRVLAAVARRLGARPLSGVLRKLHVRAVLSAELPPRLSSDLPATVATPGSPWLASLAGSPSLRVAVAGLNDGLIANASLMFGMAGANPGPHMMLVTGVAGACAGAFARAAGEYARARSAPERVHQGVGHDAVLPLPTTAPRELALNYAADGRKAPGAPERRQAASDGRDHARRATLPAVAAPAPVPGVPAWRAAGLAFLSFVAGASLPVFAFMLAPSSDTLPAVAAMLAAAFFAVGAARAPWHGGTATECGATMLALGTVAGVATFIVGRLAGVYLG